MDAYYQDESITLYHGPAGQVAAELPDESVRTIVTSPPYYGLRSYLEEDHPLKSGEIGTETSRAQYVENLAQVFDQLRRVLTKDGTLWVNLGDSYAGRANAGRKYDGNRGMNRPKVMPPRLRTTGDAPFKNLLQVPFHVSSALVRTGWILRDDIIWQKPNAKPESVKDRTSQTYEHLFMFSKRPRYYYNLDAIRGYRGPVRADRPVPNPGDVWSISITPFRGAHFATFPEELARRAILAGSEEGDTILDPFSGSGTTGAVAQHWSRKYIGIDIDQHSLELSLRTRFSQPTLDMPWRDKEDLA